MPVIIIGMEIMLKGVSSFPLGFSSLRINFQVLVLLISPVAV